MMPRSTVSSDRGRLTGPRPWAGAGGTPRLYKIAAHSVNFGVLGVRNASSTGAGQREFVEAAGTTRLAAGCVRDVGVLGGAREAHHASVERPGGPERRRARDVEALADGLVGRIAAIRQAALYARGERVAVAVPGVGKDERPPRLLRGETLPERHGAAWTLAGRPRPEDPLGGPGRLRVRDLVGDRVAAAERDRQRAASGATCSATGNDERCHTQ